MNGIIERNFMVYEKIKAMNECTCGETIHPQGWCDGFGQYICIDQYEPVKEIN